MFIVCFGNGLGNQMFQYAFYLALKSAYPSVEIKADINYIQCRAHNGYELEQVFNINDLPLATHAESKKLTSVYPGSGIVAAALRRIYRVKEHFWPHENHLHYQDGTIYHPEIFQLDYETDYLLDGTWTNELYFKAVKDEVLGKFHFHDTLDERNQNYLSCIQKSNSVGIHIRRGDYVSTGFYLLDGNYYRNAVSIIKDRTKAALTLFIFTDDPQWVKKIFTLMTPP